LKSGTVTALSPFTAFEVREGYDVPSKEVVADPPLFRHENPDVPEPVTEESSAASYHKAHPPILLGSKSHIDFCGGNTKDAIVY